MFCTFVTSFNVSTVEINEIFASFLFKTYVVKSKFVIRFDKEQIGVKEPFPMTNLSIYFIRIRNIWC